MNNEATDVSAEWFILGDQDAQSAQILLTEDGPLPVVAFHLQQAIEKYLKGYLLARGWQLRRIHDLELLIQEAVALDKDFTPFVEDCQRITEFYIESRYPTGFFTLFVFAELQSDLETTQKLIALIREKLSLPISPAT